MYKGIPMGKNNSVFLEVIEWFDSSGDSMAQRIPGEGSGDIKYGAQLVVRESQAAVFFYHGRALHVFGPGRHTLRTANIPVLTKLAALPWGLHSPLRAEVYFANLKIFPDLRWGTRDPVAFKDSELGLIRLRAFGMFDIRIVQPLLFVNWLVGTVGSYEVRDISDYLGGMIVSRFNDYMGENLDTILNLPARYDEMAVGLGERLQGDFNRFGLRLNRLFIQSITPPTEVQKAIDDRSKLGLFEDLGRLAQLKTAVAVEKASENPGTAGAGMGMGIGMMMPGMLAQASSDTSSSRAQKCPDCDKRISKKARYCPHCGHQIVVFLQCAECGKNLPPSAKFCSRCGNAVEKKTGPKVCANCGVQALPKAVFCNHCGEKIT